MLKNNEKLKKNSILLLFKNTLLELPTPSYVNLHWNWGFILGIVMVIQLLTGLMLASHYTSEISSAFDSVIYIIKDVNYGYLVRFLHINGASLFFVVVYLHIFRSIMYNSYKNKHTWGRGIIILLILMGTAFMGYVLPWGQISYWGATVITNLISSVPVYGTQLVEWIWGGFSVNSSTLTRFFMLHFLIPFILMFLIIVHIFLLHEKGSNNSLGVTLDMDKIKFHKYFLVKDLVILCFIVAVFLLFVLILPFVLGDTENFNVANPLNTPIHIIPEWYFLFAYAILRSIPNKLGGVLALLMSILIFFLHAHFKKNLKSIKFKPFSKAISYIFMCLFILLTWLGSCAIEDPFILASKLVRSIYFMVALCLCPFKNCFENNRKT